MAHMPGLAKTKATNPDTRGLVPFQLDWPNDCEHLRLNTLFGSRPTDSSKWLERH